MSTRLIEVFPEIEQIENRELRSKVIKVWEDAMDLGGWEFEDLEEMPFTLLEPTEISFAEHVRVVCRLSLAIEAVLQETYADRYAFDRDTLIAGALLADVGKLLEFISDEDAYTWSEVYDHLRHPFTGVGLCYKHELPLAVMHIVATHSWEGDRFQRRPESIIFHHADFIDFDLTKFAASKRKGSI
jgi:putative nucleotidyltransferase with HDIG domain